jgi:hypothetical protein
MYRDDEAALVRAWQQWRGRTEITDDVYMEFVDKVVRRDARFDRIHIFEILDALVNAPDADQASPPSTAVAGG